MEAFHFDKRLVIRLASEMISVSTLFDFHIVLSKCGKSELWSRWQSGKASGLLSTGRGFDTSIGHI